MSVRGLPQGRGAPPAVIRGGRGAVRGRNVAPSRGFSQESSSDSDMDTEDEMERDRQVRYDDDIFQLLDYFN